MADQQQSQPLGSPSWDKTTWVRQHKISLNVLRHFSTHHDSFSANTASDFKLGSPSSGCLIIFRARSLSQDTTYQLQGLPASQPQESQDQWGSSARSVLQHRAMGTSWSSEPVNHLRDRCFPRQQVGEGEVFLLNLGAFVFGCNV